MRQVHFGGSFAPPLSDEKIARYRELAERAPEGSFLREALLALLKLILAWWDLPDSQTSPSVHPSGAPVMGMDPEYSKALYDLVPWDHEMKAYDEEFDKIPPVGESKELRDAAYHLLWHARELDLDREPITGQRDERGRFVYTKYGE